MAQPATTSDNGVILSVGLVGNSERAEIVIPMATDASVDSATACEDAVDAFYTNGLPLLKDCISDETWVTFIQAEGMVQGTLVPSRMDFVDNTQVGTRTGNCVPMQVAALGYFYGTPGFGGPGPVSCGRNFIPCISITDVVGDAISAALAGAIEAFVDALVAGLLGGVESYTWYRVVAAIRTAATTLNAVTNQGTREYVATQRRRLLPH